MGLVSLHTALGRKEDDVIFCLRSSPYGAVSHGHNDQNCFTLEAYGEPLAIASGHYNRYGSPHHAGWTRGTRAKCGITVDGGKGQLRGWHAKGRIADFQHSQVFDIITATADEAYGDLLSRANRDVVHVRPGLFIIRDDLAAAVPRHFEYWLHALDRMDVDAAAGTVRIHRPQAHLTVRFLWPRSLRFEQTDQFDPPPTWPPDRTFENNWHLTGTTREASRQAQIITVLSVVKPNAPDPMPTARYVAGTGAAGVALEWPDGRAVWVAFAETGRTNWTVGPLAGTTRISAAHLRPDGTPEAVLSADSTDLLSTRKAR